MFGLFWTCIGGLSYLAQNSGKRSDARKNRKRAMDIGKPYYSSNGKLYLTKDNTPVEMVAGGSLYNAKTYKCLYDPAIESYEKTKRAAIDNRCFCYNKHPNIKSNTVFNYKTVDKNKPGYRYQGTSDYIKVNAITGEVFFKVFVTKLKTEINGIKYHQGFHVANGYLVKDSDVYDYNTEILLDGKKLYGERFREEKRRREKSYEWELKEKGEIYVPIYYYKSDRLELVTKETYENCQQWIDVRKQYKGVY